MEHWECDFSDGGIVCVQVRSGERIVQLAQDMVGVPLSLPLETSTTSPLQGLVYVATTSQVCLFFT